MAHIVNFDVNAELVLKDIGEKGFCVVENIIPMDLVLDARSEYFSSMDLNLLHASGEKFSPWNLRERPWRKLAAGSRTGSGEAYSQLLQTTYFWQDDQNFPALSSIFNAMVSFRNSLIKVKPNYGSNLHLDNFWNACLVHHYPQGGGHMAEHIDTLFPALLSKFDIPFLQIMVTLSSRGAHFNAGGGYLKNSDGKRSYFENYDNVGSLVLFDGSVTHGVEDIDPDILLDFKSHKGRIALFVNLYANLERNIAS